MTKFYDKKTQNKYLEVYDDKVKLFDSIEIDVEYKFIIKHNLFYSLFGKKINAVELYYPLNNKIEKFHLDICDKDKELFKQVELIFNERIGQKEDINYVPQIEYKFDDCVGIYGTSIKVKGRLIEMISTRHNFVCDLKYLKEYDFSSTHPDHYYVSFSFEFDKDFQPLGSWCFFHSDHIFIDKNLKDDVESLNYYLDWIKNKTIVTNIVHKKDDVLENVDLCIENVVIKQHDFNNREWFDLHQGKRDIAIKDSTIYVYHKEMNPIYNSFDKIIDYTFKFRDSEIMLIDKVSSKLFVSNRLHIDDINKVDRIFLCIEIPETVDEDILYKVEDIMANLPGYLEKCEKQQYVVSEMVQNLEALENTDRIFENFIKKKYLAYGGAAYVVNDFNMYLHTLNIYGRYCVSTNLSLSEASRLYDLKSDEYREIIENFYDNEFTMLVDYLRNMYLEVFEFYNEDINNEIYAFTLAVNVCLNKKIIQYYGSMFANEYDSYFNNMIDLKELCDTYYKFDIFLNEETVETYKSMFYYYLIFKNILPIDKEFGFFNTYNLFDYEMEISKDNSLSDNEYDSFINDLLF